MNTVRCIKCGGNTPEGLTLCPSCMRETGTNEAEVEAAELLLIVTNVVNIGDANASRIGGIQGILSLAKMFRVGIYE